MADLATQLDHYAVRREELVLTLQRCQGAPAAATATETYIFDLARDIDAMGSDITQSRRLVNYKKFEYDECRHSSLGRLGAVVRGKKAQEARRAKLAELESVYSRAAERAASLNKQRDDLVKAQQEAKATLEQQQHDSFTHISSQQELDRLYENIFGGPQPLLSSPVETHVRWLYNQANDRLVTANELHKTVSDARNLLNQATGHCAAANSCMSDARSLSRADMFSGGRVSMAAGTAKRDMLRKAEGECARARAAVAEARRLYPSAVREVSMPSIASGGVMKDIVFDNSFSDYRFHKRITASQDEVSRFAAEVSSQMSQLLQQEQRQEAVVAVEREAVELAKQDLQDARGRVFEQRGQPQPTPSAPPPEQAPPAYDTAV